MLSTFPPLSSSDGFTGIPFPAFEGGFTPWDYHEPPFVFPQHDPITPPKQTQNPVLFTSSSDNSNSNHTGSNSGSDERNLYESVTDERKRRRMISNRESARRSRMRKQKHLENLRNQLNRLKMENRELMNRLRLERHNGQVLRGDNYRLQSESVMLRQKLLAIRQILLVRQLQQQLILQ